VRERHHGASGGPDQHGDQERQNRFNGQVLDTTRARRLAGNIDPALQQQGLPSQGRAVYRIKNST
jgi:hypothetical protein